MGFIGNTFRTINCIVTLGGSEELILAKNEYELVYEEYKKNQEHLELIQRKINSNLESLGLSVIESKKILNKAEGILKNIDSKLEILVPTSKPVIQKIDKFNSSYENVIGIGFGGVAGGSLAVGAWATVSVLGSASTGTAIVGLSGIAATNATLAWFGGGALAAGGAGMSGGMMVLGGIVAAPMIYFATKGTYAKVNNIEAETTKLSQELTNLLEHRKHSETSLREVILARKKAYYLINRFRETVEKEYNVIRPFGFLSYLRQMIWSLFGFKVHDDEIQVSVNNLKIATNDFLDAFLKKNTDE